MTKIIEFFDRELCAEAFSSEPFTFLDPAAHHSMAFINEIMMIENGDYVSRSNWQKRQLTNLLRNAQKKSNFWKNRMPSRRIQQEDLKFLPVLSRADLVNQVNSEGPIYATTPKEAPMAYATGGSTGTPVKIYVCEQNSKYNLLRNLAQYFMYGLNLNKNRTYIGQIVNAEQQNLGIIEKSSSSWAGPLAGVFQNGTNRIIEVSHAGDNIALVNVLKKSKIDYIVCPNRFIENIISVGGVELLKQLGVTTWIHLSDYREPAVRELLCQSGIKCFSNYSSGEIGPIAYECSSFSGNFHVAHSNVIIEEDPNVSTTFEGITVHRLLITALHSHATPIIRYDIGDFGNVSQNCPCGHRGVTISNIYGRKKNFLLHPNGSFIPFYLRAHALLEVINFKECKIRQIERDLIIVEICDYGNLSEVEIIKFHKFFQTFIDPAFRVVVKKVDKIDWSDSPKKLFFTSLVEGVI